MKKKLLALVSMFSTLAITSVAFAQDAASNDDDTNMALAIAAGLGMAIAAFGGALGQGRAAAAALEGIARNPNASGKLFVPMILGLALIESLVIYSLVVSLQLVSAISN